MSVEDNFSTMPLRFRVWDDKNKEMYSDLPIDETAQLIKFIGRKNAIISQDTGLKDKNGKGIYTGDIVQRDEYTRAVCRWDSSSAEVEFEMVSGSDTVKSFIEEYEIIGTIWQTPELLVKGNG